MEKKLIRKVSINTNSLTLNRYFEDFEALSEEEKSNYLDNLLTFITYFNELDKKFDTNLLYLLLGDSQIGKTTFLNGVRNIFPVRNKSYKYVFEDEKAFKIGSGYLSETIFCNDFLFENKLILDLAGVNESRIKIYKMLKNYAFDYFFLYKSKKIKALIFFINFQDLTTNSFLTNFLDILKLYQEFTQISIEEKPFENVFFVLNKLVTDIPFDDFMENFINEGVKIYEETYNKTKSERDFLFKSFYLRLSYLYVNNLLIKHDIRNNAENSISNQLAKINEFLNKEIWYTYNEKFMNKLTSDLGDYENIKIFNNFVDDLIIHMLADYLKTYELEFQLLGLNSISIYHLYEQHKLINKDKMSLCELKEKVKDSVQTKKDLEIKMKEQDKRLNAIQLGYSEYKNILLTITDQENKYLHKEIVFYSKKTQKTYFGFIKFEQHEIRDLYIHPNAQNIKIHSTQRDIEYNDNATISENGRLNFVKREKFPFSILVEYQLKGMYDDTRIKLKKEYENNCNEYVSKTKELLFQKQINKDLIDKNNLFLTPLQQINFETMQENLMNILLKDKGNIINQINQIYNTISFEDNENFNQIIDKGYELLKIMRKVLILPLTEKSDIMKACIYIEKIIYYLLIIKENKENIDLLNHENINNYLFDYEKMMDRKNVFEGKELSIEKYCDFIKNSRKESINLNNNSNMNVKNVNVGDLYYTRLHINALNLFENKNNVNRNNNNNDNNNESDDINFLKNLIKKTSIDRE